MRKNRVNPDGCLTAKLIDQFDAIIVMHRPDWVEACLDANDPVPIIRRTIGQSGPPHRTTHGFAQKQTAENCDVRQNSFNL